MTDDYQFSTEPKWQEFTDTYRENLGRHSVNYHSWFAVKDEGMFKDFWDWMDGTITQDKFYKMYPRKSKFNIYATDINTGKKVIIKCRTDKGNIEDVFGFGSKMFMPFMTIDDPCLDGFAIFRSSTLFPKRGTLSVHLVDNTHWPALNRGRFILINENYIPDTEYKRVSE